MLYSLDQNRKLSYRSKRGSKYTF